MFDVISGAPKTVELTRQVFRVVLGIFPKAFSQGRLPKW